MDIETEHLSSLAFIFPLFWLFYGFISNSKTQIKAPFRKKKREIYLRGMNYAKNIDVIAFNQNKIVEYSLGRKAETHKNHLNKRCEWIFFKCN